MNYPICKSPRKADYDYRQPGGYFVTICTHMRLPILGQISQGSMLLNAAGEIAHSHWQQIPAHRSKIELDVFVVMPNHVHGLLWLDEGMETASASLSSIIGAYKAGVTREIRRITQDETAIIWQKSFHDHIVRTQNSLDRIRAYVVENPQRWAEDTFFQE
jgi:putative transposase